MKEQRERLEKWHLKEQVERLWQFSLKEQKETAGMEFENSFVLADPRAPLSQPGSAGLEFLVC